VGGVWREGQDQKFSDKEVKSPTPWSESGSSEIAGEACL